MHSLGYDYVELLKQFSLPLDNLSSPDARVSIPKFMRYGHACIAKSKTPWLGLIMGQYTSPTNLGIAGLLALTATNVKQSCQQLAHYEPLSKANIRGQSSFNAEKATISFYSIAPYNNYNFFVVDSVLSGWYQVLKTLTQRDDAITKIYFEFPAPTYIEKYKKLFNCEVLFGQANNYIELKPEALHWPCVHHCASTFEFLKRQADTELQHIKLGLSFDEVVSRVISPLLNGVTPSLSVVAAKLNMAPWTVRRKLVEEGGSFQKTLNKTRKELSINYVTDTALSLGEIAYLVGFSSPAAFQRAFKRWTGIAPGQYRIKNISAQ